MTLVFKYPVGERLPIDVGVNQPLLIARRAGGTALFGAPSCVDQWDNSFDPPSEARVRLIFANVMLVHLSFI